MPALAGQGLFDFGKPSESINSCVNRIVASAPNYNDIMNLRR